MKVVYAEAPNPDGTLDTDVVLSAKHGGTASEHVTLDATGSPPVRPARAALLFGLLLGGLTAALLSRPPASWLDVDTDLERMSNG